jgi:Domain of unknown function (DUF4281)
MLTPENLFQFFNTFILLPWALMFFLPNWKLTQSLTNNFAVPLFYAVAYSVLIISLLVQNGDSLDFMSLEGIMRMFGSKEAVLVGWIHYLCFDLFVGTWAFQDAQKHKIPHLLLCLCLVFMFVLAPLGYVLYRVVRKLYGL